MEDLGEIIKEIRENGYNLELLENLHYRQKIYERASR